MNAKIPLLNKYPPSIKKLIQSIQQKPPLSAILLKGLLEEANVCQDELHTYNEYCHPKEFSYGRNCIWEDDSFKMYVLSWNPGDFTAIHSHTNIDFGVVAFYGKAEHRTYDLANNHIRLIKNETIEKNSSVIINNSEFCHSMGNISEPSFLTLHIYGCFDESELRKTKIVHIERNMITITDRAAFLNSPILAHEENIFGINSDSLLKKDYVNCTNSFFERIGKTDLLKELV